MSPTLISRFERRSGRHPLAEDILRKATPLRRTPASLAREAAERGTIRPKTGRGSIATLRALKQ
uniref:Uncharacterized protein n=1 Tax=Anguilla anguilla TaxID=7936 RepID=A0A0E9PW16_ANGAN